MGKLSMAYAWEKVEISLSLKGTYGIRSQSSSTSGRESRPSHQSHATRPRRVYHRPTLRADRACQATIGQKVNELARPSWMCLLLKIVDSIFNEVAFRLDQSSRRVGADKRQRNQTRDLTAGGNSGLAASPAGRHRATTRSAQRRRLAWGGGRFYNRYD